MSESIIDDLRKKYHKNLSENVLCKHDIADSHNKGSVIIANGIRNKMGVSTLEEEISAQTAGSLFVRYTKDFLDESFSRLSHLRPGNWNFSTAQGRIGICAFDQYDHIAQLQSVLKENKNLEAALGRDYIITPDITVARLPVTDEEININKNEPLVDNKKNSAYLTPLRADNFETPRRILHASISCKWTMRSDRSQNTRTEALNLIRLRKGKTPLIAAVIMEPLPTRIASIALGTGDIDCTYHAALNELIEAVNESGREDQADMLQIMVEGRRLRDISDLPFDLAA